jgi:hypothetical protein
VRPKRSRVHTALVVTILSAGLYAVRASEATATLCRNRHSAVILPRRSQHWTTLPRCHDAFTFDEATATPSDRLRDRSPGRRRRCTNAVSSPALLCSLLASARCSSEREVRGRAGLAFPSCRCAVVARLALGLSHSAVAAIRNKGGLSQLANGRPHGQAVSSGASPLLASLTVCPASPVSCLSLQSLTQRAPLETHHRGASGLALVVAAHLLAVWSALLRNSLPTCLAPASTASRRDCTPYV